MGGTYITVRGCAPFDTETFNPGLQKQMIGTYWKGQNIFSFCDYDECNSAWKSNLSLPLMLIALYILNKL